MAIIFGLAAGGAGGGGGATRVAELVLLWLRVWLGIARAAGFIVWAMAAAGVIVWAIDAAGAGVGRGVLVAAPLLSAAGGCGTDLVELAPGRG